MIQESVKKSVTHSSNPVYVNTLTGNSGHVSVFFVSGELTGKERDPETGLYYYGARYLDPRTSRWISADPAMWEGDYIPGPGRGPSDLGGMGGIFNYVNFHVYHYGGNNPVKLIDPNGRNDEISELINTTDLIQTETITPLTQNSEELSGIAQMAEYGCYFRAAQAVAELEVGVALTAEQIQDAVTTLQNTANPTRGSNNMVINANLRVNNPDVVINDAFERLGRSDLTGTVGWGGTPGQQDYIIQESQVTGANQHFTLHDNSGNLLFDPRPGLTTTTPTNRNVYIHGN